MANKPPSAKSKLRPSVETSVPSAVEPLTRRNYKRLPVTQSQIESASKLKPPALIKCASERDEDHTDYLSAEALVYFIRRADRKGDRNSREALFRELLERCTPFFRSKFRGFTAEEKKDLQGDVLNKLVEDILAPDDRGDFMQVRFWIYLEKKAISACREVIRNKKDTESLDTNLSGDGEPQARTKLEMIADDRLSPEEVAMISQGLSRLQPQLREVFLLRHYVGMNIGDENANSDDPNATTLAQHFGCTGRTIRNWLKKADELLVDFRKEKE
jgi:DNA-directed RNA polymerase specialized sigma24 family protein